jgi:hypothetical protein
VEQHRPDRLQLNGRGPVNDPRLNVSGRRLTLSNHDSKLGYPPGLSTAPAGYTGHSAWSGRGLCPHLWKVPPGNAQPVDACGQVLCTTGVVSGHVTDSSENLFPRHQDLFGDNLCTNCGRLWTAWGKLCVIHRRARVLPRFCTGPVYKNSRSDLRKGRFSTVSTAPTTTTQEITPTRQKARWLRTILWITSPRGQTSNLPLSDRGAILIRGQQAVSDVTPDRRSLIESGQWTVEADHR